MAPWFLPSKLHSNVQVQCNLERRTSDVLTSRNYRGFDSFYGFYLGSEDYYIHNKRMNEPNTVGYDFRFNEKILKGRPAD